MKLLFIEDEKFTRDGIRKSIKWEKLGITELREAIDGLDAMTITEQFQPDIVLSDIRMPRMDGIEFAFQLRKKYPNCKIIFMSGYADKEYLKAAISLKAISYVEKPIDIDELDEALQHTIAICKEEQRLLDNDAAVRENLAIVKQEAALQLIRGNQDIDALWKRLAAAGFHAPPHSPSVTILLKIVNGGTFAEVMAPLLEEGLISQGFPYLYAQRDELHIVVHIFSSNHEMLQPLDVQSISYKLASSLNKEQYRYSIAAGNIVPRPGQLLVSYSAAAVRLQEAFYQKPGSVVFHDSYQASANLQQYQADPDLFKQFQELLIESSLEQAAQLLRNVTSQLRERPHTLIASVKELYYRLMLELHTFAESNNIALFPVSEQGNLAWELILECHFLEDVHAAAAAKLTELQQILEERGSSSLSALASRVIKYIHQHYMEDDLSVQEMSEVLQLTSSHMIAAFKDSTGKTIKQYVTEYRMEKAKDILKTNRYKVSDVASRVGFKDGEYFAKIFRKHTGMTPSEFRERSQL
ncbi:response regulator [Paenibacillus hexagrammi]|uniref:Response regulator n=1 Tax=Paenibacillus hexagrammi TaxID=2908839 RepID=A0ABY3SNA4_9BACL|nr:response regulator [Paenibacillus sp. YPD9-1]UJF34920.1 response regulator [Paenibacillus sp. YPD9-1]